MLFRNKIISAYLTSILGVFSGLLTNLWMLQALTIRIDPVDFGLYAYIFQISSYLLILQMGMDFSVSRQIAEYLGKGEILNANAAFWELKRFNRYASLVLIAAVVCIAFAFNLGIGVDPSRVRMATMLVLLVGVNQLFIFFQRPFSAALIGGHYQEAVNIVTVIRTLLTTLLAYLFLMKGAGVFSTPVAEIFTQLGANGILVLLCNRKLSWKKNKPEQRDLDVFQKLLHFGFFSTIGGVAWTLEATSDVLLIKHVLKDLGLLSIYVVWWRFPQMLFDLASRLGSSAFPIFASRHGANDGSASQILTKLFLAVTFFASLSVIGISLWLPVFINVWFPSQYHYFKPFDLAFAMGVLVAIRIIGNMFAFFILSSGNTKLTTRVSWVQAIIKIIIAFFAVHFWGLVGLLGASCLAASIQLLVYGNYLLKEKSVQLSMVIFVAIVMSLAFLLPVLIHVPIELSLVKLVSGIFLTGLLWGILYTAMALLNKSYRNVVFTVGKKLLNRPH